MPGYLCHTCGEFHPELPLVFGPDAPIHWYALPEETRSERAELTDDRCVIDGTQFFMRGRLEIPIIGSAERFVWLVWVSLSKGSFTRTVELWDVPGREREPPYFGWLSTELAAAYGVSTVNLATNVHARPVGTRPFIEVEPTEHPLAVEQREGVTWEVLQRRAELLLHGG